MKRVMILVVLCLLSLSLSAVIRQIGYHAADINAILYQDGDLMIGEVGLEYDHDIVLFDVSDPFNIRELAELPIDYVQTRDFGATINGDYLIVASYYKLCVIDISDLHNPELLVEEAIAENVNPYQGSDFNTSAVSDHYVLYNWYYMDDFYEYHYFSELWDISDPTNPRHLPHGVCSGADDVAIKDDYAFIAKYSVVKVFDVGDPENIVQVSQFDADGYLEIQGDYLFASSWDEDILISVDISDPENPQRLDQVPAEHGYLKLFDGVAMLHHYQSNNNEFIDISDPNNLEFMDYFASGVYGVIELSDRQIMILDSGFFRCVDLSDPSNERLVSTFMDYDIDSEYVSGNRCELIDDRMFILQNRDIWIADYSDLENPELLSNLEFGSRPRDVQVIDDIAYLTEYGHGIRLYDISDPEQPFITMDEYSPYGYDHFYDMELVGETMYTTSDNFIVRLDVSDSDYPRFLGSAETIVTFDRVMVADQFLYAWSKENILQVFDIGESPDPVCLSTVFPGVINDVDVNLNYLYVTTRSAIKIYDLIEPGTPNLVGTITADGGNRFTASSILGNSLIVADNLWNRLLLYDIASPESPELTSVFYWNQATSQMILQDDDLILNNLHGGINVLQIEAVGTDEGNEIPKPSINLANYPNPFNPETTISYSIKESGPVRLQVFNIRGQLVRTLIDERVEKGEHRVQWHGDDREGKPVSSGVYLYRIQAGDVHDTRKMLLMK